MLYAAIINIVFFNYLENTQAKTFSKQAQYFDLMHRVLQSDEKQREVPSKNLLKMPKEEQRYLYKNILNFRTVK